MLRNLLIGFAGLLILAGVVCLAAVPDVFPAWLWLLVTGTLLLAGTLYERVVYKALESGAPGAGFERTTERFVDDQTGKPVTVYIDPKTGERRDVEE